jgi:hypothetical protein
VAARQPSFWSRSGGVSLIAGSAATAMGRKAARAAPVVSHAARLFRKIPTIYGSSIEPSRPRREDAESPGDATST